MSSKTQYRIRTGRAGEASRLGDIEALAAQRFLATPHPEIAVAEVRPLEDYEKAIREGLLFVAAAPDDDPVGFVMGALDTVGDAIVDLHVEEMDVDPNHGRRGLGRMLLAAMARAAQEHGARRLTLTTFAAVAWNRPFYERVGFRVLADAELGPALDARMEGEARAGLARETRVAMMARPQDVEGGA